MITTLTNAPRTMHMMNLADTSWQVLIDNDSKIIKVVESISFSCDGADTAVTMVLTKNGTDYYVLNAVTVTKNTTFMITDHHLRIGSQIQVRIKAANANQISAVAVTLEQMPQQNAQGGVVGPGIA